MGDQKLWRRFESYKTKIVVTELFFSMNCLLLLSFICDSTTTTLQTPFEEINRQSIAACDQKMIGTYNQTLIVYSQMHHTILRIIFRKHACSTDARHSKSTLQFFSQTALLINWTSFPCKRRSLSPIRQSQIVQNQRPSDALVCHEAEKAERDYTYSLPWFLH